MSAGLDIKKVLETVLLRVANSSIIMQMVVKFHNVSGKIEKDFTSKLTS